MAHSLRSCTTHQPHCTVCVINSSVNIKFRVLQPRRAAFLPASARNSSTFLCTLTQNYNAEVHEAILFLMNDQTPHKNEIQLVDQTDRERERENFTGCINIRFTFSSLLFRHYNDIHDHPCIVKMITAAQESYKAVNEKHSHGAAEDFSMFRRAD